MTIWTVRTIKLLHVHAALPSWLHVIFIYVELCVCFCTWSDSEKTAFCNNVKFLFWYLWQHLNISLILTHYWSIQNGFSRAEQQLWGQTRDRPMCKITSTLMQETCCLGTESSRDFLVEPLEVHFGQFAHLCLRRTGSVSLWPLDMPVNVSACFLQH